MLVEEFSYDLPRESIAQEAIEPRHSSRLLDARDLSDHVFLDLPDLLEDGDLLVVNNTRVRNARLKGVRVDTGGNVEFLILGPGARGTWRALARPSRRLKADVEVEVGGATLVIVAKGEDGLVDIRVEGADPEEVFRDHGEVPLPPYFEGVLSSPDRYQTIYAENTGSAAAPTAGLHFTDEVFERLRHRGIPIATVDLQVSLDTFRPMTSPNVEDHVMHSERANVPDETVDAIRDARRTIAVGTTVVRALESRALGGELLPGSVETDLFIRPGFEFKVANGLITNFHLPSSTLLVMLASFMGDRWRLVYETALERSYRFLSFGDSMFTVREVTSS